METVLIRKLTSRITISYWGVTSCHDRTAPPKGTHSHETHYPPAVLLPAFPVRLLCYTFLLPQLNRAAQLISLFCLPVFFTPSFFLPVLLSSVLVSSTSFCKVVFPFISSSAISCFFIFLLSYIFLIFLLCFLVLSLFSSFHCSSSSISVCTQLPCSYLSAGSWRHCGRVHPAEGALRHSCWDRLLAWAHARDMMSFETYIRIRYQSSFVRVR